MKSQICIVCLRADRTVKNVNSILYEFHDELCEYGLPGHDFYYCTECVHLLKKFYKFQRQCRGALKIYKTWTSTKKARRPISILYTLLPPSPLGLRTESSVIVLQHDVDPISTAEDMPHDNSHPVLAKYEPKEVLEIKLEKEDPTYDVDIKNFIVNVKFTEDTDNNDANETNENDDVKPKTENNLDKKRAIETSTIDNDDDEITLKSYIKKCMTKDDEVMKNNKEPDTDDDGSIGDDFSDDDFNDLLLCDDSGNDNTKPGPSDDGSHKKKVKKRHKPLDIERIKSHLQYKFSYCGDILAKDGTSIDKDMILKNIPDRVVYHDIRKLCRALRGKPDKAISTRLTQLLNNIQEKFKDDEQYVSVFDIQYLSTYDMRVKEFINRKTYECYTNAVHKCDICYTPFKLLKHYKNHMEIYHNESSEGKPCPICKMRIKKRASAPSHSHAAVYKCKKCPLVTYYRSTMLTHFGKHTGKVYRCEDCNVDYKCASGYFLHMSRYHSSGSHVCVTCGRGFSTAQGLTAHSYIHEKDPQIPEESKPEGVFCKECDVTFPTMTVYEAHVIDVHKERKRFQKGTLRDSNSLPLYHKNIANKTQRATPRMPRVKCRLCNASRLGGGWLKTHFKKEHPNESYDLVYADSKQHLCDVCGVGFSSIYMLRDHMTLHTGALPFPCDLCTKHFRTRLLVKQHRYKHFPKNNLCTVCGKKFRTKANLAVHVQGHTGEKNHKCEMCGKNYRSTTILKEHVNAVHYNIRRVRKRAANDTSPRGKKKIKQMEEEESE